MVDFLVNRFIYFIIIPLFNQQNNVVDYNIKNKEVKKGKKNELRKRIGN